MRNDNNNKAPDRKYKLERVLNSKLPDHIKERVRPGSRHAMNHPTFRNYAYTMLKQLEDRDKPHPLPEGQYDIILVDPPWKLDADTCEEGRILEMLPQIPIAAKNSIMFMWA